LREFKQPNLLVSKCLEYCNCRYNGDKIPDKFVRRLEEHVNYIKICPEVEMGLGVPRNSIRLIKQDGNYHLVDSMTGEDHTAKMDEYIENLSYFFIISFFAKGCCKSYPLTIPIN